MNEHAQKVIDLIRAKTNLQWWAFHGADVERIVKESIADAVRELQSELDPPVCRLQFPDGSVPENARAAAEGWKAWYDKLRFSMPHE